MHHPLKIYHLQGLIQCYLDLDNVNTALNLAEGAIERQPEFTTYLLEMQAEPLWRLGRWSDLDELLKKPPLKKNESWGVQLGHALLYMKDGKRCYLVFLIFLFKENNFQVKEMNLKIS